MLKSIANYNRGIRCAALRKKNQETEHSGIVVTLADAIKTIGTLPEEIAGKFSRQIVLGLDHDDSAAITQFIRSVAFEAVKYKKAA